MRICCVKVDYEYVETRRIQKKDKTWIEKETPKSTQCEYFTNLNQENFNKKDSFISYVALGYGNGLRYPEKRH